MIVLFRTLETEVKIGLGGGCHWCTEAVFQTLAGISQVEQGFIRSDPPNASWSEAVLITFDPAELPLEVLIEVHLRTHAATSHHKMRGKYRSAIYVYDAGTGVRVGRILHKLQKGFDEPLVTKALFLADFKASDDQFQNYYLKGPDRPFCKSYIDPKLALLRRDYAAVLRQDVEAAE
ncbi:peptide-methionine (S)-S-oxide reductase [Labrenzia sp. PHM005]|uniref:peptide-methionine (S)-S-oxide reductase n=1 Tax=Labrenzia sp. PHM005 TaxID=2590016 RepID=UPI0011405299|nr:peptide-methionine (S)-S-oxide reductase [Labrenzia sp. PHM005]QDG78365.1 peptide methionine sulfoxide reductase [Labrenzia sp. PHM005]